MEIMNYQNIKGNVKRRLIDLSTGEIVQSDEHHNMIVNTGRYNILKMLNGEGIGLQITQCSVGSGGALVETDPFTPIPPTPTDVALVDQKYISNIGDSFYNGAAEPYNSLTFATAFLSSDVNAMINEVGLWLTGGILFARHTFPTMYMMADKGYSLEIDWTFEFDTGI